MNILHCNLVLIVVSKLRALWIGSTIHVEELHREFERGQIFHEKPTQAAGLESKA